MTRGDDALLSQSPSTNLWTSLVQPHDPVRIDIDFFESFSHFWYGSHLVISVFQEVTAAAATSARLSAIVKQTNAYYRTLEIFLRDYCKHLELALGNLTEAKELSLRYS